MAINNGLFFEAARAITPELIEELDEHGPDLVEDPSSRPDHEAQGRQKSVAALKPFDPYAVLARLSGPMTTTNSAFISDLRSHYDVLEGQQGRTGSGLVSDGYRIRLKRKAYDISRSQYEVYSFSTKHNLSEAATDELLEMLSNVNTLLVSCCVECAIMIHCVLLSRSDSIHQAYNTRP